MITSTPANRGAARLALIVASEQVETAEQYQKRPIRNALDFTIPGSERWTWCNKLAENVTARMGAPIPPGLRANEQHAWLVAHARNIIGGLLVDKLGSKWEKTDAHTAQAMADQGCLAIAAWANPMKREDGSQKSGHIAVLMPSLGEPGVWCAQAGQLNFTRELLQRGFGAIAPDYFCHP